MIAGGRRGKVGRWGMLEGVGFFFQGRDRVTSYPSGTEFQRVPLRIFCKLNWETLTNCSCIKTDCNSAKPCNSAVVVNALCSAQVARLCCKVKMFTPRKLKASYRAIRALAKQGSLDRTVPDGVSPHWPLSLKRIRRCKRTKYSPFAKISSLASNNPKPWNLRMLSRETRAERS